MIRAVPLEVWWNPMSWESVPLIGVVAALWVIVMVRSNATYWLGRGIARGTASTSWKRLLESRHYSTAQAWINRWGAPAVILCYLTVGVQTMVHLAAGTMRMSLTKYLPAAAIGSVLWALLYGTIGFIGWIALLQLWAYSPPLLITLVALATVAVGLSLALARRERETKGTLPAVRE